MRKCIWAAIAATAVLLLGAVGGAVLFTGVLPKKQLRGTAQADSQAAGVSTPSEPTDEVGRAEGSVAAAEARGIAPKRPLPTTATSTTLTTTETSTTVSSTTSSSTTATTTTVTVTSTTVTVTSTTVTSSTTSTSTATSTTTSSSTRTSTTTTTSTSTSTTSTTSTTTTLKPVTIFHISDTHTLHKDLESQYGLLPADILIHTGDFSNHGTDAEIEDFNAWLGRLKAKYHYKYILLITGNHDWYEVLNLVGSGRMSAKDALDSSYFKKKLSNAIVLDHEKVELMGINFFGSTWCPWHPDNKPAMAASSTSFQKIYAAWASQGGKPHRFDEIPAGVDVLMTHGPAAGVLDAGGWGSSEELLAAIKRVEPKVHLFGHVHEQRGHWARRDDEGKSWSGGVEYEVKRGSGNFFPTRGPPPSNYPVEVVSNAAVMSNGGLEGGWWHIAGPGRLFTMTHLDDGSWKATM